jgi:LPS export ABC transporter protein LptC
MNRRNKKLKSILIMVIAVSVMGVVWVFYQLRQDRTEVKIPLPVETATKAIMALSKVRQTATKDGTVQWVLDASEAELETATGKMVLQSPKVVFHLDDGTRVNLTAKEGILHTRNNNIEVRGNVLVRNDRYTLATEALAYKHKQRVLNADTPVQIIGQEIELKAATMHYDLKTNRTRFNGAVEGILFEDPAI